VDLRDAFRGPGGVGVQVLNGLGGVGKTQIATEYAHRFAADYDLVWWISAEQPELVGEQIASLADALHFAVPDAPLPARRDAVFAKLRRRGEWLLIFDGAQDAKDVMTWLPGSPGHVLITSRTRRWTEVAVPLEVGVLARSESVGMLKDRMPWLEAADANEVAGALGDLPLGIAQAAGYMADTATRASEYLSLLGTRAGYVLDQAQPPSYRGGSLAAVTQLAFDGLAKHGPAAADLVAICSFLAPEALPKDWFTHAYSRLPGPLADSAVDPAVWPQVLALIARHALARVDQDGLRMHRLTQAIVRDYLGPERAAEMRGIAEEVIAASDPGDESKPSTWDGWARLLPHVLALQPGTASSSELRDLACRAAWYLLCRGDAQASNDLALSLHEQWSDGLGTDDAATLAAANVRAAALRSVGRYSEALRLDKASLDRYQNLYGYNHADTLACASNLASDLYGLGKVADARVVHEDTLHRLRSVLGENHPDALACATNLAAELSVLGDVQQARELNEDTLDRYRRTLGPDHPSTLHSASNLADNFRELGDGQRARQIDEDILSRLRRALGEDHPDTLRAAVSLAVDLRLVGEVEAARELDTDVRARIRRTMGDDYMSGRVSRDDLATVQPRRNGLLSALRRRRN